MNNTKVMIGFPKITELRIGTAIRISILTYVLYNEQYDNIVPYEKLLYLLKDIKNVYRFGTVKNYSDYVASFYLGEKMDVDFKKGEEIGKINQEFGSKMISIEVLTFFYNVMLKKIIKMALNDFNNEKADMHILTIKSSKIAEFYEGYSEDIDDKIEAFCNDFLYWLEYHQIIHIPEFIVTKKEKNILVPIKFSFIDKL